MLATTVKAICVGVSSMVDIRYFALTEQHRMGHLEVGRHVGIHGSKKLLLNQEVAEETHKDDG